MRHCKEYRYYLSTFIRQSISKKHFSQSSEIKNLKSKVVNIWPLCLMTKVRMQLILKGKATFIYLHLIIHKIFNSKN